MYCYTYVNNISCVLNELSLWSDISSEHPIFIQTVAKLTNKNLPKSVLEKLDEVNKRFSELKNRTKEVSGMMPLNPYMSYGVIMQLRALVERFLANDRFALSVIEEVKKYGKEDKVWQTLLEHITEEQTFMYELFMKIRMQLI